LVEADDELNTIIQGAMNEKYLVGDDISDNASGCGRPGPIQVSRRNYAVD
jgi:hypothetical protein